MPTTAAMTASSVRENLESGLSHHSEKFIESKLCRKECLFLQKYGSPKQIADRYDPALRKDQLVPFECSLCCLCGSVCPVGINPAHMFLEMSRGTVDSGNAGFSQHGSVIFFGETAIL